MKKVVLIALLSVPLLTTAQYNETIRSGRPGQAIGAYTLGKSVFQIQSGVTHNQVGTDSQIKTLVHTTGLRLGITEKFEISGVVNWQMDRITSAEEDQKFSGISNTQIGARYNLLKNQGAVPAIGIQGRLLLKAQSRPYRRDQMGSKFILATGNKINDWLSIGTNFGLTWSGNHQDPQSLYAFNFSFSLSHKIGAFTEMYGSFNGFNTHFDGGLSYLLNKDLQLDLSAGWQGDQELPNWFIDGGISYRLNWRE